MAEIVPDLPVVGADNNEWGYKLNNMVLAMAQAVNETVVDLVVRDGNLWAIHVDDTETDLGPLPVGPGGSDAGVAGYIQTVGSQTQAALSAQTVDGITQPGDVRTAVDGRVLTLAPSKKAGVINMLDVVGTNNGTTDHGPALAAVIAGLASEPNSSGATPTIYFPRGQWVLGGSYANSESKRFNIMGDGPAVTTIKRPTGATGDLFTLAAKNTRIEGLSLEGGRYQGVVGDLVVLDGAYTAALNLWFNKSGRHGLVIGKNGAALAHVLDNIHMRETAGYGIWTVAGSGCTDGMWSNVEIGNSGLYGVRIGTGSQNVSNLHVWGSGLESTSERDGIFIEAGSNMLTTWQSEKNLGRGVRIESTNNVLIGGRAWGNVSGAIYMLGGQYNVVQGNTFHQNTVTNSSGSTSTALAVIFIEGASTRNVIAGNVFWDNTNDLAAGSYVTSPTYPYPGRTGGIRTQALLFAEGGTADLNTIANNVAQRELTRLGSSTAPYVIIGNSDVVTGNDWGVIPAPSRTVTSGAIRIPADSETVIVAVSQEITSVLGGRAGRVARLIFTNASPSPVRDNGTTLNLNGDFIPTTNDVLSLISDGTNWYEVSRSAN